jgi:hypothetical protein
MNRRAFVGSLTATAAGLALASTATMTGCSALDDLESYVPIALAAFDGIVALINPVAGSALEIAIKALDVAWTAVSTAIANYQHDTTDPKNTLLEKIIAALNSLTPALDQFLSTFLGGLPAGIQSAVEAGVNLLIATLTSIANRLAPGLTSVAINRKAQAVVPPMNKSQFLTAYNAIPGLPRKLK